MKKKKAIISTLIIISFILLILSVLVLIQKAREQRRLDPLELEDMTKEEIIQSIYEKQASEGVPFFYFIPVFAFFGVVVGVLIYYIFEGDLEKKEKIIANNTDVILKLLNYEERKVIKKIVENNGKISQSEISYMAGFNKVRAHRLVESLVQKGILEKEALGKIRIIKMNKELYEILKNK